MTQKPYVIILCKSWKDSNPNPSHRVEGIVDANGYCDDEKVFDNIGDVIDCASGDGRQSA